MSTPADILAGARWRVEHGDALEVLRGLPDGCVDAVVTDPPYGTASETKVQKQGGRGDAQVFAAFDIEWDADLPLDWIADAARVLRDGGSFVAFTDTKAPGLLFDACRAAGLRPLQLVFWRKLNPPPQPRQNFQSAIETAVFARKPGRVLFWGGGGATQNVIEAPIVCRGTASGGEVAHGTHPTQKPEKVMREILRAVALPGGLVLDPFAGSGTTGVAALAEGCRFIGVERESAYVEIARNRLRHTAARPLGWRPERPATATGATTERAQRPARAQQASLFDALEVS